MDSRQVSELLLPRPELERVFKHDPKGLQRLLGHEPTDRVDSLLTRAGDLVVTVEHRKLHSTRSPVAEAERFTAGLNVATADMVVLFGYGSGYPARAITAACDATVLVFEPDLDVLMEGLDHGPVPESVFIVTEAEQLGRVLYQCLGVRTSGVIARWVPSTRLDPDTYGAAVQVTTQAIDRARLRARTARLRASGWLSHYLHNLPHVAHRPGLNRLHGSLEGVPAIVVAAGPSLDRNVEILKQAEGRALILSVNTAAAALARAGVEPDAIVCVESLDISTQLADLPFINRVAAFLELTSHPNLWELPFAEKVAISVDTGSCSHFSASLDPKFQLSSGFCVANAAVAIAHKLGCNPIMLVGSDLAYAGDRIYASGTIFQDVRAAVDEHGEAQLTGMDAKRAIEARSGDAMCGNRTPDRARTERVAGWGGGGPVVTTREFKLFRDWYGWSGENLRERGIHPINSTEGGASIPNWTEIPLLEALERHVPIAVDAPTVPQRFQAALIGPAVEPGALVDALRAEHERVSTVLTLGLEARALVGHDPDGDIHAPPDVAERISKIHRHVQGLLHQSPLAREALYAPLDILQDGEPLTTLSLYDTMESPLAELLQELARMLQSMSGEFRRAS